MSICFLEKGSTAHLGQEGNISIDDAVRHAAQMGVDVTYDRHASRAAMVAAEGKIYNFGMIRHLQSFHYVSLVSLRVGGGLLASHRLTP